MRSVYSTRRCSASRRTGLTLLLLAFGPTAAAQQPAARALRAALAGIAPAGPGCAVAVEHDGVLLASDAAGLADLERGVPISPSTVFYAGSVSKQFVATAMVLLSDRGILRLDDSLGHYLPDLADPLRRATLRQLMHHTGGIPDYLALASRNGRDWSDRFGQLEALALLRAVDTTDFLPGTRWRYSNGGYLLLAEVASRVSGRSFRVFADSALLRPLAMGDSHFHDDLGHSIDRLAVGYRSDSSGTWTRWPLGFAAVGSGGLYTTVLDLARWSGNWWHNRLGAGDPALVDRLSMPGTLATGDTLSYAMGVIVGRLHGRPVRRHGGGLAGYRATLLQFPLERIGIAVLCNHDRADAGALAEAVAARLLPEP